jgi:hypothetical protein
VRPGPEAGIMDSPWKCSDDGGQAGKAGL